MSTHDDPSVTCESAEHSANAPGPTLLTAGKYACVNERQPWNAPEPIELHSEKEAVVIIVEWKALSCISVHAGKEIVAKLVHSLNAYDPTVEHSGNTAVDNELQYSNAHDAISEHAGKFTSIKPEHPENALSPMYAHAGK